MVIDVYAPVGGYVIQTTSKVAQYYTESTALRLETPNFFAEDIRNILLDHSKIIFDDNDIATSFANSLPRGTNTIFATNQTDFSIVALDELGDVVLGVLSVATDSPLVYGNDWIVLQPDKRYAYSLHNRPYVLLKVAPGTTVTIRYITTPRLASVQNQLTEVSPLGMSVLAKVSPTVFVTPSGGVSGAVDWDGLNHELTAYRSVDFSTLAALIRRYGGTASGDSLKYYFMCPGGKRYTGTTFQYDLNTMQPPCVASVRVYLAALSEL